jgi:schlafen family protein
MLFVERPITVQHIRDFCTRFEEGLRVEYKSTFDQNVKDKLPKIISSFANSHGGVLVIGVNTLNGAPQPPFDGFSLPAREELPLTVENICLRNIYSPILPRITPVQSDIPDRVFLVIEVEESGEAPHAIENSTKVYVRTGNASNPYDLAEVDLIIDLVKRRKEPLELRDRLLAHAEQRAYQVIDRGSAYVHANICPTYPRSELCSSEDVWDFLLQFPHSTEGIISRNNLRRVPDGAASITQARSPHISAQYFESNKYGLLLATRQLGVTSWNQAGSSESLRFSDVLHTLLEVTSCAERFYARRDYGGNVLMRTSLHNVRGQQMRFLPATAFDDPSDYRCYAEIVSVERLTSAEQLRTQKRPLLITIIAELLWPFWQSLYGNFPTQRLEEYLGPHIQ